MQSSNQVTLCKCGSSGCPQHRDGAVVLPPKASQCANHEMLKSEGKRGGTGEENRHHRRRICKDPFPTARHGRRRAVPFRKKLSRPQVQRFMADRDEPAIACRHLAGHGRRRRSLRLVLKRQPEVATELLYHLDFGFAEAPATTFFMLGAAAVAFTTSFFGFFSSRPRFDMPLAMICVLPNTAFNCQRINHKCSFQECHPCFWVPPHGGSACISLWGKRDRKGHHVRGRATLASGLRTVSSAILTVDAA